MRKSAKKKSPAEFRQFFRALCPKCAVQTTLSLVIGDAVFVSRILCPVCLTELLCTPIEVRAFSGDPLEVRHPAS
jgi:hypothetical protein